MEQPAESHLDRLIFHGTDTPPERFFLFGQPGRELVMFWHPENAAMVTIIEDNRLAKACCERARALGFPAFASWPEVYAHAARQGWPGWERYHPADGEQAQ